MSQQMISTLIGELPLSELELVTGTEKVPCGDAQTTMYFYKGELVRQDQTIVVDRGALLGGKGGLR